jgi:MraZ protein
MFAGRHDHALDDKGRTMVPKRFRERLVQLGDARVWITHALGTPNHLDVRPATLFASYQARFSEVAETPQVIAFKRFYFGSAEEVEIDGAGRILVPVRFRQRLSLADRLSFVGMDAERFQIWHPNDLDQSFAEVTQNAADILAHLAGLGV